MYVNFESVKIHCAPFDVKNSYNPKYSICDRGHCVVTICDHNSMRHKHNLYKNIKTSKKTATIPFHVYAKSYTYRLYFYRLMLTEAYASIEYTMLYYSQEKPRAHMPFNFNFISYLNKTSSANDIINTVNLWLDNMPHGQWPNWVVSIHKSYCV